MTSPCLLDALTLLLTILGWIAGAFTFYIFLLLPFALGKGKTGKNARAVLRDLLTFLHALIRSGRR